MDNERLKEYRRNYYAAHKTEINRKRREKYQDQRKKNRMDEHPDEQHKKTEDTNVTGCRYDRLQKKLVANKWSQEESSNFVNQMISSSSSASTFRISGCLESFSDHMSTVRTEDSTNDSQIGVVGYKFGTHYNDIDCTQRHSPSHVIARCVNSNEDFIVNVNSTQNIPPPINNNFLSGNDTHVEVSNRNMEGASNGVVRRDERTLVLPKVPACRHCGAYKFYKESVLFCCSGGEVILAETVLPEYLVHLITGTDRKSKDFQNQIRTYNNTFAFTSIGMHCDEAYQRRDHGIYTVKVQGQVYHFLDDLVPQDVTKKMSGIQFYFFDTEHQTENRMSALPRLDPIIVRSLVALLEPNPYSQFLKQASMLNNIEQYCIIIRSDPGLDQRRYNKPTSSEVAGIWIEDEVDATNNMNARDIRVYTKSGRSHIVQYYYRCYDPLQYVLMFPNGEPGWHSNIGRVGCKIRKKGIGSSKNLSDCPTFEAILDLEQSGTITFNIKFNIHESCLEYVYFLYTC